MKATRVAIGFVVYVVASGLAHTLGWLPLNPVSDNVARLVGAVALALFVAVVVTDVRRRKAAKVTVSE